MYNYKQKLVYAFLSIALIVLDIRGTRRRN